MLPALVALVVGQVVVTVAFVRYLDARDKREGRETQLLLNRIQAPETAVAQTIAEEFPASTELYVPFDDDETFHEAVRPE